MGGHLLIFPLKSSKIAGGTVTKDLTPPATQGIQMLKDDQIADTANALAEHSTFSRKGSITEVTPNLDYFKDRFVVRDTVDFTASLQVYEHWAKTGRSTRVLRVALDEHLSKEYHLLGSDCFLSIGREEPARLLAKARFDVSGWTLLQVQLQGDVVETFSDQSLETRNTACILSHFGEGSTLHFQSLGEQPRTLVVLGFKPEMLESKLGLDQKALKAHFNALGRADKSTTQFRLLEPNPRMVQSAREILDLPQEDALYPLMVESIATSLLLQCLNELRSQKGQGDRAIRLRDTDIQQLNRVKHRIEADYVSPLSLQELGKFSGLNRQKLTGGFKLLFGVTVNEYLVFQRMTNARGLLKQGLTAGETARRVGYQEQSSFTRAFKRFFGVTPREYLA